MKDVQTVDIHTIKTSSAGYINYCYLIVDGNTQAAALVDPAWELETIAAMLRAQDVRLETILLTHSHYDHVHLVPELLRLYRPTVCMAQAEIDYYGFRCERLIGLQDGDVCRWGGLAATAWLTPGHTAGGMCYQVQDSLFTGDTLFSEGCGVCTMDGGDPEQLYDSLCRLQAHFAPETRIYPAHSYGVVPGQPLDVVQSLNIYLQFEKKEHFVDFRMRKNQKYIGFR